MKKLIEACLVAGLVVGLAPAAMAQEVTLDGTVMCGKCARGESEECQDVLIVGEGEAASTYWIVDNEVSSSFGHVCQDSKPARVTGTVSQVDGRTWIAARSMEARATR